MKTYEKSRSCSCCRDGGKLDKWLRETFARYCNRGNQRIDTCLILWKQGGTIPLWLGKNKHNWLIDIIKRWKGHYDININFMHRPSLDPKPTTAVFRSFLICSTHPTNKRKMEKTVKRPDFSIIIIINIINRLPRKKKGGCIIKISRYFSMGTEETRL